MIEVHTFQEQYTGVQIIVFHCNSKEEAQSKFTELVINSSNWIYAGIKQISF